MEGYNNKNKRSRMNNGQNFQKRKKRMINENDDSEIIQPEPYPISFSLNDFTFTQPNVALPMIIKLQINNFSVLRVSVNEGSSVNILYSSAFFKMGLSESMLKPFKGFLMGAIGETVPVKGYIDLNTTFGKGGNSKMIKVRYLVVDSWNSVYNVVIGRPTVADLGAVISTLHLTMKYPVGDGMIGVVKADFEMARKCYDMCPNAI